LGAERSPSAPNTASLLSALSDSDKKKIEGQIIEEVLHGDQHAMVTFVSDACTKTAAGYDATRATLVRAQSTVMAGPGKPGNESAPTTLFGFDAS